MQFTVIRLQDSRYLVLYSEDYCGYLTRDQAELSAVEAQVLTAALLAGKPWKEAFDAVGN